LRYLNSTRSSISPASVLSAASGSIIVCFTRITARHALSSATVTFDISADPDLAAVEIQNRIKLAESRLPAEVIQNGISVEKQAASQRKDISVLRNRN
jgi:hypothetical protein